MALKPTVIALHGDWMDGKKLRRDMGDPEWCDLYPEWKKGDFWQFVDWLSAFTCVILIGYSRGGSEIATLTHYLNNIAGVVLYESPMLAVNRPRGGFPVMWIQNNKSRYRGTEEMMDTRDQWVRQCKDFTAKQGSGRHIKWFPMGHAWDQSLNVEIAEWIERITNDE